MIVAVIGHRPTGLWGYNPNPNYRHLREDLARRFLSLVKERKADRFLFGMALGVDSMAFDVCVRIREKHHIQLVAAVPYANQAQHWEPEQKEKYSRRLEVADETVYVDELSDYAVTGTPVGTYDTGKLLAKSQYLVDHASTIFAVWSGTDRGDTYDAVCRARKAGKELIIYNPFESYGR